MSDKHTPGPWGSRFYGQGFCVDAYNERARKTVAFIYPNRKKATLEANARLIAAAPEMLEALRSAEIASAELCIGQDPANQCWVTLAEIKSAIAKATTAKPMKAKS